MISQAVVNDEDRDAFERDGVVCLRGAIGLEWVEALRDALDAYLAAKDSNLIHLLDEPGYTTHHVTWKVNDVYRNFVFKSAAAEIAGLLLNSSKIMLFEDSSFVKEPGSEAVTPWHQDLPYYPFRGNKLCTVWLSLDSIGLANGGLEYVRGSHRWGLMYRPADLLPGQLEGLERGLFDDLNEVPDIDNRRDDYSLASFELEPGDCVVHHALMIHGAPANHSDSRRRGVATRWLGDDMKWTSKSIFGENAYVPDPGLQVGDPVECDEFPLVWTRG